MIMATRLAELLLAHAAEHGDSKVEAYSETGTAPHGSHDVLGCDLERSTGGEPLAVLRLGVEER